MALLMDDPSRSAYCKWDLKLIKAYYINQAFDIDGHPPWVEDSPDILWTAKKKTLRSAKAVEDEQEKLGKAKGNTNGVRVMAVPVLRKGASWPTRKAWSEGLSRRPELDEDSKMSKVAAAQEERARIKLEEMAAAESS